MVQNLEESFLSTDVMRPIKLISGMWGWTMTFAGFVADLAPNISEFFRIRAKLGISNISDHFRIATILVRGFSQISKSAQMFPSNNSWGFGVQTVVSMWVVSEIFENFHLKTSSDRPSAGMVSG